MVSDLVWSDVPLKTQLKYNHLQVQVITLSPPCDRKACTKYREPPVFLITVITALSLITDK